MDVRVAILAQPRDEERRENGGAGLALQRIAQAVIDLLD